MSRLAVAFVLALAATNAQDTKSEQSQTPAVASANGTRPFLFDGRMKGDGDRQGTSSTIIIPRVAPSSCHRNQASPRANNESAHTFTRLFTGSISGVVKASSLDCFATTS